MDPEVQDVAQVPAENAAPEAGETALPVEAPVSGEEKPVETKESKTFKQEEVDEIVAKRLAKAQRKWEREQAAKQPPAPVVTADGEPEWPKLSDFANEADFYKALKEVEDKRVEFRDKQRQVQEQQQRQQRQRQEIEATHAEREESAMEKYEDYYQVTRNPKLPITNAMADAIAVSDNGPDIAYHLGKNPKEAERIASLPPIAQAKEIGKLEAKLLAEPPQKKQSAAPPPITPVKPGGNGAIDTSDPKSLEKLGTSGWIEAERARQRREYEARHR